MGEWRTVNVEEIIAKEPGSIAIGPFGTRMKADNYVDIGVPVVRGQNLADRPGFVNDFVYVPQEFADELENCKVYPGDLVFPHRGAIGRVGIVRENDFEYGILSTSLMKLRVNPNFVDSSFLYYYFLAGPGRGQLLARASTVGTPGIGQPLSSLRTIPLHLPPLEKQAAISSLLGLIGDNIAQNELVVQSVDRLLQASFDALDLLGGQRSHAVGDVVLVAPKTSTSKFTPPVAFFDMNALPTDGPLIGDATTKERLSGARFMNGDTLFARITPCLQNGKTGFVSALGEGEIGCGSTEFIVLRARRGHPDLLPYALGRNEIFRAEAERHMEGTSGRQRVSAQALAEIPMRMPTHSEVEQFAAVANPVQPLLEAIRRENQTLSTLRDTLLLGFMDGSLSVRAAEDLVSEGL